MTKNPKNIAVIGAGIGGMSAAYDLKNAGQVEQSGKPAGHKNDVQGLDPKHGDNFQTLAVQSLSVNRTRE